MIKLIQFLAIASIICLNCKNSNTPKDSNESQQVKQNLINQDTIYTYSKNDYDTIEKITENVRIRNDYHQLIIRRYSLNDSSIVNIDHSNKVVNKNISHNYVADVILKKEQKIILQTQIDKHIFKHKLEKIFYNQSVLLELKFDAIRSNKLYFKSILHVPNKNWKVSNGLGIFYRTKRKGEIDSYDFRERKRAQ